MFTAEATQVHTYIHKLCSVVDVEVVTAFHHTPSPHMQALNIVSF